MLKRDTFMELQLIAEDPGERSKLKSFMYLELEYNQVNLIKFLLDSHYTIKIENRKVVEISPKANNANIFHNYNGSNALNCLLSHANDLPIEILERLFDKLKTSDYIVDEIVGALAETKCQLDRVVRLGDPRVTRKMLEFKYNIGYPATRKAVKQAMNAVDIYNLEVLLHCGSNMNDSRQTFVVELKNMLLDSRPDLERAKLLLQALMTWNLYVTVPTFNSEFSQVFHEASAAVARMLLDCEYDEYARSACDHNCLIYLFGNANVDAVDLLRNRSFDVDARDGENTALKLAVKCGSERNVRWLLNEGASIDCPRDVDLDVDTPLTLATESGSTSMIDLLLAGGANINFGDGYRTAVLHVARDVEIVKFLLLRGANAQATTHEGYAVFENKRVSESSLILAHLALMRMQRMMIVTRVVKRIRCDSKYEDFWGKCLRQISWMKTRRVYGLTTMFDVVCGKVGRVTRGMDVCGMKEKMLDSAREGQLYPYYVTLLDCKFEDVFLMQELQRKAGWVLSEAMAMFDVDHLVIDKIIDFLTFQDLMVFE